MFYYSVDFECVVQAEIDGDFLKDFS